LNSALNQLKQLRRPRKEPNNFQYLFRSASEIPSLQYILEKVRFFLGYCPANQVQKRLNTSPYHLTLNYPEYRPTHECSNMFILVIEDMDRLPNDLLQEMFDKLFLYPVNMARSSLIIVGTGSKIPSVCQVNHRNYELVTYNQWDAYSPEDIVSIVSPYTELFAEDALEFLFETFENVFNSKLIDFQ
jgi:hypothetical protein